MLTGHVCTLCVIFAALLHIPTDSIWHVYPTVYVIGLQGANLFDSLILSLTSLFDELYFQSPIILLPDLDPESERDSWTSRPPCREAIFLNCFCGTGCLDVTAQVRLHPLLLHPQPQPVLCRQFRPF